MSAKALCGLGSERRITVSERYDLGTRQDEPRPRNWRSAAGVLPIKPLRAGDRLMSTIVPEPAPRQSEAVPTSVYRYYDRGSLLLYVGITSRATRRQSEHSADKEWWGFVVRQEVEHYGCRQEAMAREKELIRQFRPPFNRQHNADFEEMRELYLSAHASISDRPLLDGDILPASEAFEMVHGKIPLSQIEVGNTAKFAVSSAFKGLLASVIPSREKVLLLAPRKIGLLVDVNLFSASPEITFVGPHGGIPALKNAHLHLKVKSQRPFVTRIHEARAEKAA